jgi:hypothetical protein
MSVCRKLGRIPAGGNDREHPRFSEDRHYFYFCRSPHRSGPLKGYQRGAVDYISVPVIPDLLRAKVSVFAELHRKAANWKYMTRSFAASR